MPRVVGALALVLLAMFLAARRSVADTSPGPAESPASSPEDRLVVVISDLHMGAGRAGADGRTGDWLPEEDFRWPKALEGFLKYVDEKETQPIDLVIAGDFLELWQPGPQLGCKGCDGCTVAEMRAVTDRVVEAHRDEIDALFAFGSRGGNCVYVTPGNHDAALVLPDVRAALKPSSGSASSCFHVVPNGLWVSSDRRVVVEHGHQIGSDPNGYADWPEVRQCDDGEECEYLTRSWGEQFVQSVFNEEEARYPLIDNLSPETAGVRYRIQDRGPIGSAADVARFLKFNLLETSLAQKIQVLGESEEDDEPDWDLARARELGHRLLLGAMDPKDPLAKSMAEDPQWEQLRSALDELAKDEDATSEAELRALCDQLAIRDSGPRCQIVTAGALFESLLYSRRQVVEPHVADVWVRHPEVRAFVYGHTHAFELPWPAEVGATRVQVANSGAFQRLIDDDRFREIARQQSKAPSDLLKDPSLEKLDPCYTVVFVRRDGSGVDVEVKAWVMDEKATKGDLVDPCGGACPNVGHGCG